MRLSIPHASLLLGFLVSACASDPERSSNEARSPQSVPMVSMSSSGGGSSGASGSSASVPMASMSGTVSVPAASMGASVSPAPETSSRPLDSGAAKIAPDFVTRDSAGRDVRLSDFKDKIVVLDFWATWCVPCMHSLPHTQELAAKYKDQGVVVLAVCTSDTREKFEAWAKKNESKYPNIVFTCDPHERGADDFDERASNKLFDVSGLPTQLVIGRDRTIAAKLVGYDDKGDERAAATLAHLGVTVDATIVAQGDAQLKKEADEAAAEAAEEAAHPAPTFVPRLGELKSGDAMPDVTMVGADGKPYSLSSLRGKTLVLGFGWEEVVPVKELQAIGVKYAASGVLPIATIVNSSRADLDTWLAKNQSSYTFAVGWDAAGKYTGDMEHVDMKALAEFHAQTLLRKIMGGEALGSTPAMPIFVVVDAAGKFVGLCWRGEKHAEGLGNLLLRAGVKLADADMPKKIASPEAFVVVDEAPRAPEAKVEELAIGAVAPDFVTTDASGKDVRLADYKGKVIVLDFWATWCGPCVASMPHTQDVAAHYKDQGVVVIGSCTSDSRASFEAWVRKNHAKYPDFVFAHDAAEKSPERASRKFYGVSGIPAQFVIGRDGKVVARVSGYRTGEVLLEGALAKAGIQVDAETVKKAEEDLKKRASK